MYTLKVTKFGLNAANWALMKEKPAGRPAIRLHHRCVEAIEANLIEEEGKLPRWKEDSGEIVLTSEDAVKYLGDAIDARVKEGIEPQFSRGFAELFEVLESVKAVKATKEGEAA